MSLIALGAISSLSTSKQIALPPSSRETAAAQVTQQSFSSDWEDNPYMRIRGGINDLLKDHISGSRLAQLQIAQPEQPDQPEHNKVTQCIRQGSTSGYAVLLATQDTPSGPGTKGMPKLEPGPQRQLLGNLRNRLKGDQGQRPHRHAFCLAPLHSSGSISTEHWDQLKEECTWKLQ
ncbi:Putative RNA-binding protein 15B [Fukomys damarensis]|uniref:Putative RNA-binding protein 15B n=1 Tax=Fukomys damarensis TaxID=885580 RepID=A0A091DGA6_FUKDA|nr:Putative RNA-binding protein 15B [Fukomys damarensis]